MPDPKIVYCEYLDNSGKSAHEDKPVAATQLVKLDSSEMHVCDACLPKLENRLKIMERSYTASGFDQAKPEEPDAPVVDNVTEPLPEPPDNGTGAGGITTSDNLTEPKA